MTKYLMATKNEGKVRELRQLLADTDIEILSLNDLSDHEEVEETGLSFAENAVLKAEHCYRKYGVPSIADDSGICIRYLLDMPGVFSARFLPHLDYPQKNALILSLMEGITERKASYECVISFASEEGTKTFHGSCEGEIAFAAAGENGFGYDPIFYYPQSGMTLAEMDPEEKNKISHRGEALRKLVASFD